MYKIMLVEDEPEVIDSMLENIDWGRHGFAQPLGCRHGAEAVEIIENGILPDAIITDICMPLMDGLELTRLVREKSPKTLVVVLSGHDEFAYAQKALQLKAYDYILKPITPANLEKILIKLKDELDRQALEDADASASIAKHHFLNRLLAAEMDHAVMETDCKRYDLCFEGKYHVAAVLDIDPWLLNEEDFFEDEIDLLRYGMCNMAQEITENLSGALVFQDNDKKARIIVSAATPQDCEKNAHSLIELVAENTRKHLKSTSSAGIGEPVSSPQWLYRSAAQAESALKHRFYYGPNCILRHGDIHPARRPANPFSNFKESFETAVNNFDHKGASKTVTDLFEEMKQTHLPFEKCLDYCQRLVVLLLNFTKSFVSENEIVTLEKAWEQHSLYSTSFLLQMEQLMGRFMNQVFELQSLTCNDTVSVQMVRAENFIQQNYANPKLSLQMITDHLALSTSYFSAIYKTRTGCTFIESLTKIRMQKAKQILQHTDQRTYEVADAVGFSDPQYFSAAFKRVTGMTPREYREHSRKSDTRPCGRKNDEQKNI